MNAMCKPSDSGHTAVDDPGKEKIPGKRDYVDEPDFLERGKMTWKHVAEFETKRGSVVYLPPEIALNPRLFDIVMNAT